MDTVQVVERIQGLQHLPGALLPILHSLQEEFGYIDDAMIPLIAEALEYFACGSAWSDQFLS